MVYQKRSTLETKKEKSSRLQYYPFFSFVTSGYLQTESFRKLKHLRGGIWNGTGYNVQTSAGHNQNIWEMSKIRPR